ncbi:MAG: alpha-L-glutamate ligase-like protein [Betaproteobacteria bacterium RIFCSPLOWO2_02_FULL_63_19]|nr:MAG: alpha-L-glutamate ligase-like protein [Betaproteobacteria bacterium RIFCSPLOWO2_02_FULL_63_19]
MMGLLGVARTLRERGVMGINERNAEFNLVYNERARYPLVDDKLLTKELATKAGAAVPRLYGVIEIQHQVETLAALLADYQDFVIKPARGSQGDGIVVVVGRSRNSYRLADGALMEQAELEFHVSNILSGIFSLGEQIDRAMIEYRVNFDPVFERITYRGVPDIRIIVFVGVPVMAMVRLPTRAAKGKANLHQGAIGSGVDIATGCTLTAVWRDQIVTEHPDTGNPVQGVQIPHWDRLLEIAAQSYELTGLGYLGIDIVLDRGLGPLILELNARPGLNIQIANRAGLRARLDAVLAHRARLVSIADRVAFARERFAAVA